MQVMRDCVVTQALQDNSDASRKGEDQCMILSVLANQFPDGALFLAWKMRLLFVRALARGVYQAKHCHHFLGIWTELH